MSKSLVKIDVNAEVYEDSIDFRMGPFKGYMEAVQGEKEVFADTTYPWCNPKRASILPASTNKQLCGLLHGVRGCGVTTALLSAVTFVLYCVLALRSLKGEYVAKTARTAMALHLLQATLAFVTVALWAGLSSLYASSLQKALGPEFAEFSLPYGRSFHRVIVVGFLALVAAAALHAMAKRSVDAIQRDVTIERKRSEFELKEAAEKARRQAEDELKVDQLV